MEGPPVSWNIRLTVRVCDGEEIWEPREIFYDDDGEVIAWSEQPVSPSGESWSEVTGEIMRLGKISVYPAFDLDTREWRKLERGPDGSPSLLGLAMDEVEYGRLMSDLHPEAAASVRLDGETQVIESFVCKCPTGCPACETPEAKEAH